MPAYPFAQMPSLGEFVERAQEAYECQLRRSVMHAKGPGGEGHLSVLHRPGVNSVVLPDVAEDVRLSLHTLRSLCARLNIPPAEFGLDLDHFL